MISSKSDSTTDSTLFPNSPASPGPAPWGYDQDGADQHDKDLLHMPIAPPTPSSSLMSPIPSTSVIPTYDYVNIHSNVNSNDDDDSDQKGNNEESMENATPVVKLATPFGVI